MAKILEDIRVLDLTQFLSGPFGTQILAGMGAEVIKIEPPGQGAAERSSPPFAGSGGVNLKKQSPDDLSLSVLKRSRNKMSVTLNLKSPEGKAMLFDMVKKADVIMENFRPGTMEKLGLSYDVVKEHNPSIIYCSLNGFGAIEAYKSMPAFDIVIQAMCGVMSVNGDKDGPPTRTSVALSDISAGIYSCVGILGALLYRNRTGKGQFVEISMMESALSFLLDEAPDFWGSQGLPLRNGSRVSRLTPFNIFSAKDGYYVIASGSDAHWQGILKAMKRDDLTADERYSTTAERSKRTYEVDDIINGWSSDLTIAEVLVALEAQGIPCAKVKEVSEVVTDPELLKAGSVVPVSHPKAGAVNGAMVWDNPISFSDDKVRFSSAAPMLGQHNEKIYGDLLGLDASKLEELKEKGVI